MSAEIRPLDRDSSAGEPRPAAARAMTDVPAPDTAQAVVIPAATRPASIWPLILWVTVPYWLVMSATRISSYLVKVATVPGVVVAGPGARSLQHVILFGVLILFYRLAFALGWPHQGRVRAALGQVSLALLFACLATPTLNFSMELTNGKTQWVKDMLFSPGAIPEQILTWLQAGVLLVSIPDFFLSYWFGLALVLGLRAYLELRDHKLRVAQLQSETVRARLQALRMQLNPHFLFNTLHSVSGLIETRPAVARQIIVRLGDLLRRTLRDGETDLVPLSREIDFVRNYLEIQQLRFPDRLRFAIKVEAAVQGAMVPSLILQPLAENAVLHGATEEEEQVLVTIEARHSIDSRKLQRWLELSVHNTGPALADMESSCAAGSGAHIGTGNTRARLRTLYGENCSVEFAAPPGGGFLARVRIPLQENQPA